MKNIDLTLQELHFAEKKIGYKFRDINLLRRAFVHSTYANIHNVESNERLEFLGDSVLQLIVSERLYDRHDGNNSLNEGKMTDLRQKIVCKDTLLTAAEQLGLDKFLLVEGSASNVGGKTISSLFETITAAVYLDGGYEEAKKFIIKNLSCIDYLASENYKGKLQELLQKNGMESPKYIHTKTGKDNNPEFSCIAVAGEFQGSGKGKNKLTAEQNASKNLMEILLKNMA